MGCIDTRGKEAIPFVYSEMNQWSKGYINVCINEKWGCIDNKGRIVIPCLYDKPIYTLSRDKLYFAVELNSKIGVADKHHNMILLW